MEQVDQNRTVDDTLLDRHDTPQGSHRLCLCPHRRKGVPLKYDGSHSCSLLEASLSPRLRCLHQNHHASSLQSFAKWPPTLVALDLLQCFCWVFIRIFRCFSVALDPSVLALVSSFLTCGFWSWPVTVFIPENFPFDENWKTSNFPSYLWKPWLPSLSVIMTGATLRSGSTIAVALTEGVRSDFFLPSAPL